MHTLATIAILFCCALTAHGEGRQWTSSTSAFHVEAELVDAQNGHAYLKEANGRTVAVPLAKLGPTDREFVSKIHPAPEVITGRVVGVVDGDTLTVVDAKKDLHKIRLDGIDAPEGGQAFGTQSKKALSEKVFDKPVRVEWRSQDKYGRILGNVFVGDRWVNRDMLQEGWAWHYREYSKSYVLAEAEASARAKDLGLWSDEKPTPPWEFRHPVVIAKAEAPVESTQALTPTPKVLPLAESPPAKTDQDETTVYITATGTKYHTPGCRSLAKSSIAMSLADAAAKYEPCSICHPPAIDGSTSAVKPLVRATPKAPSKPVASVDDQPVTRSSSSDGPVTGSTATGIPTYTGPRGGQYHYSKSGNKVYERKKK